jgi:anaerobic dimethyl sulfoxide reductase subunit B (iron-sulfur subunit)
VRNGFIFNHDLCVSCKACIAACLLENKWPVKARNIYTYNNDVFPNLPVLHLSMACNHCRKALCLDGCPTGAYYLDKLSYAVLIDSEKCIGCRYCSWNCPYDAPKLSISEGIIEKCNLCNSRILAGNEPACTSACPTGALRWGEIPETTGENDIPWIPERHMDPALLVTGSKDFTPLKIIPDNAFQAASNAFPIERTKNILPEWSLVAFSFLTTISVALSFANSIKGNILVKTGNILLILIAGLLSLFHLKIRHKAWKAIINILSSPLSREIALFTFYSIFSITAFLISSQVIQLMAMISGLLLLIVIDSVYTYTDRSKQMIWHSGQTFLTGLLMASFFLNALFPFIFIAALKFLYNLWRLIKLRYNNLTFAFRIIRVALLILVTGILISGAEQNQIFVYILFLSGELADRIIYYIDFDPININSSIINHLKREYDEKEGNKQSKNASIQGFRF